MGETTILHRREFLAGLGIGTGMLLTGCTGMASSPVSSAAAEMAAAGQWPSSEAFLAAYIAGKPLPGAMAAIARGTGAPSYLIHGDSAFEDGHPVTPDTLWRVYSMTKPITGMAAMLLVEDGRLLLDQPISELLPEWSQPMVMTDPEISLDAEPAAGPITVRHLLTHTSGLGYSIMPPGPLLDALIENGLVGGLLSRARPVPPNTPTSIAEFSEQAARLPLIANPGEVWSYSMSLEILSRVIEVASGMGYEDFLRRRIFGPLGMTNTFFRVPAEKRRQMTDNFVVAEGEMTVVDPADDSVYLDPPPMPFAGAGLVSSAHDYDRFLAMLLGEGAVGESRIMTTETARLAMSDLLPAGVDKSRMFSPSGFGAGGRVVIEAGPNGESVGTYGWGGAAGQAPGSTARTICAARAISSCSARRIAISASA